jgi:nucleoid-associated protein YgaU
MATRDAIRAVRIGGLASVAVIALVAAAPPSHALPALLSPSAPADPTAPLVALAGLVAWTLLAWLSLVCAVTLAGRLPGTAGRAAAGLARHMAPAAVRRLVALALGATLTTGVAGSTTAYAAPPAPRPVAASLDWPTGAATPELDWAAAPVAARQVNGETVVVRAGDSLWAIAAAHLPDDATVVTVAQAWPAWWEANRDAVGPDPGLIHPGLHLTPPSSSTSS